MLIYIPRNGIGHKIFYRFAVVQRLSDPRGGYVKQGDAAEINAAPRGMFIPGAVGVERKKRAEIRWDIFFGLGHVSAGPAHNNKIAGAEKLRVAFPGMNFAKCVKADNKKKLSGRTIDAAEMFDGVKRIGVAFPLQFAVGHLEERIVCSGNTHHLKAVPGGYNGIFFMRRHMGRNENNFPEAELLPYLLCRPQVPQMHGVECTAKKTCLHNACRASCSAVSCFRAKNICRARAGVNANVIKSGFPIAKKTSG